MISSGSNSTSHTSYKDVVKLIKLSLKCSEAFKLALILLTKFVN